MGEFISFYIMIVVLSYFFYFDELKNNSITNASLAMFWPIVCGVLAFKALHKLWHEK